MVQTDLKSQALTNAGHIGGYTTGGISMSARTTVIFCNEPKRLAGESVCFGFRNEGGYLPKSTVVCGFMMLDEDTKEIGELIEVPIMRENQIPSWQATLTEAREYLRLGHVTQETLAETRSLVL